MKTNVKLSILKTSVICLAIPISVFSCSKDETPENDLEGAHTIEIVQGTLTEKTTTEGKGKLDDRSKNTNETSSGSYKVYKITGGQSTDKNSVRIEREYKLMNKGKNRKSTFQATYNIESVSPGGTYIAQAHSKTNGVKNHFGPIYLVKAYSVGKEVHIYREDVNCPQCKPSDPGGRSEKLLGKANRNSDFTLKIITGWNSKSKAFNRIYFNGVDKGAKTHSRTDQTMRVRYGAYRANNKKTTKLKIKNVSYSRNF